MGRNDPGGAGVGSLRSASATSMRSASRKGLSRCCEETISTVKFGINYRFGAY